jgi:ATP-dependent Clp protease ATP-binding subunit ClpC
VGTEHLLLALIARAGGRGRPCVGVSSGWDLSKAREELLGGHQGGRAGWRVTAGKGEKTPVLDQFCRDLTQAASGELDPVIGRAKEIERIVQILSRRTKNNPC